MTDHIAHGQWHVPSPATDLLCASPLLPCTAAPDHAQLFEAAFEVGVKSGGDAEAIANASRSKTVADSATASYQGSGGPGTVADMDALYKYDAGCALERRWGWIGTG